MTTTRRPRPKTLFLPVVGLLAAVLVLFVVVTVTTYYNFQNGRRQAVSVLEAQAAAIVSGLTAGLRTGWRHWVWRPDSLQNLVEEMAWAGEVDFIALVAEDGRILAHSDPNQVGREMPEGVRFARFMEPGLLRGRMVGPNLYLAGRRFLKEEISLPRTMGPGGPGGPGGMGPGMMRRHPEGEEPPLPPDDPRRAWLAELERLPRPELILVALKTQSYRQAASRQLWHGLVMALVLFVLGSAAIYFIFVVQNYRTIDRTLRDLSTYTSGVVDSMPGGLISLDGEGRPVMVNRAARTLFGWGNRKEGDLADDPVVKTLFGGMNDRLTEDRYTLEVDIDVPSANGKPIPLAVSAARVPLETGPEMVLMLRDLRPIRALEDQVRRGEKLAAVGRLAAGVAHEVRNPLSSMRGLARFLARDLDEQSREAQYLKVMVDEIDRINRVITGLLDFARPRVPERAPVSLNEAAEHTLGLIEDDARLQGIVIDRESPPDERLVLADRDMVIQAVLNLLLNAVEAMPDGGRLTVRTGAEKGWGWIGVEDTGPGVSFEERSRLVDPFYTTKKKGAGLGLAQVAGIMEAHEGRLEIGGEPGRGGRFVLWFPLAQPTSDASVNGKEA